MKHDRENTTAKAELVAKLGQMEGQTTCAEAGQIDSYKPLPYIDNLLLNSGERLSEGLPKALELTERREDLKKEISDLEQIPKYSERDKETHLQDVESLKPYMGAEPWESDFWEREFLKRFLPLFNGVFQSLTRKDGKNNIIFQYYNEDGQALDPFIFPKEDYYKRLELFKEDLRQGGALTIQRIEGNAEFFAKRLEEAKAELEEIPEAVDLTTTTGRKYNRALSIPTTLTDLLNISKQDVSFLHSATDKRLKIAIGQKLGLTKYKTLKDLEKLNDDFSRNFFTTKNIMKICNVGKLRALQIIREFSRANFFTPVTIDSDKPGVQKELIHFLKVDILKDSGGKDSGLDLLRPKLSLDALSYLQRAGQKRNLPPIDSAPVCSLGDLAFKMMVQLGDYSHEKEAHADKRLPAKLWLQVNVEKLYKDIHERIALSSCHNNRLKADFIKAIEQLTANGIFQEAPFLGLPLRTKKGDLRDQVEICPTPDLMSANTKVSLNGLKKPGTTWNDIIRGSLIFCLGFRSMADKDRERVLKGIEGKRKEKAKRTRKANSKKSDRHHEGGSADRDEGIIYSDHK